MRPSTASPKPAPRSPHLPLPGRAQKSGERGAAEAEEGRGAAGEGTEGGEGAKGTGLGGAVWGGCGEWGGEGE